MAEKGETNGSPKPTLARIERQGRRLLILLAVGGILIAGTYVYRYYFISKHMGSGPAGPAVPREPFAEVWTERKVLLLGIGDSITEGYGASPGRSYFQRLVKNPDDEFPDMKGICLSAVLPNLTVRNLSLSGSNSIEHLEDQVKRLQTQPADVFGIVVMTTGGNDLIHDYGRSTPKEGAMYGATRSQAEPWICNFEKRLDTMIGLIEKSFPGGCLVFLANIYDPTDGLGDAASVGLPDWPDAMSILADYNAIIARCAQARESVHLANIHSAFLGHGIHHAQSWREHYHEDDPHYWYCHILEDPNDRGYDAVRRLFLLRILAARDEIR